MERRYIYRYAIELAIVIVGVTIAFWLNTLAEDAKEQANLGNYYLELQSDLNADRRELLSCVKTNRAKRDSMYKAIRLYFKDAPEADSVKYYSMMVGNYNFFHPTDITYVTMVNSGDLKLINDLELKRNLVALYDQYEDIVMLQENHLQALDENYFPRFVHMVDYITGELLVPIEKDILIKNYFAFMVSELDNHVAFYRAALAKNQRLDSLINTTR